MDTRLVSLLIRRRRRRRLCGRLDSVGSSRTHPMGGPCCPWCVVVLDQGQRERGKDMYLFDVTQRLKQTITRRPSRAVLFFCPMRDGMTGVRQNTEMNPSVLDRIRKESDSFHNFCYYYKKKKKTSLDIPRNDDFSQCPIWISRPKHIFNYPRLLLSFLFSFGLSLLVCPLFFICAMASKENVLFFSIGPYLYPDKYK